MRPSIRSRWTRKAASIARQDRASLLFRSCILAWASEGRVHFDASFSVSCAPTGTQHLDRIVLWYQWDHDKDV